MKVLLEESRDAERRRLKTDLEARLAEIFARCPALCGFTAAERELHGKSGETELYLLNIEAYSALGAAQAEKQREELGSNISSGLRDLLNERPEAAELLSGRTFARTWH